MVQVHQAESETAQFYLKPNPKLKLDSDVAQLQPHGKSAEVVSSVSQLVSENSEHHSKTHSHHKKREHTGLAEGLKLIVTNRYVFGLLCISTISEIVGTVLEYQMKVLGFLSGTDWL